MQRFGAKGEGKFERISWEAAITEITDRWKALIAAHGPQAIAPYSYLGNQGLVHGLNGGDAFFNRLGATIGEKCYCESGSSTAWIMTVGPTGGLDVESLMRRILEVLRG